MEKVRYPIVNRFKMSSCSEIREWGFIVERFCVDSQRESHKVILFLKKKYLFSRSLRKNLLSAL
jgi:hypothetical protein